jgi:hypothetical protein
MPVCGVFLRSEPAEAAGQPSWVWAGDRNLPEVARGLPAGGRMRVYGFPLDRKGLRDVDLERFEVFGENLVVEGAPGAGIPTNAYFRVKFTDDPSSVVVLTVPASGRMRGVARGSEGTWTLGPDPRGRKPGLRSKMLRKRDWKSMPSFSCDVAGDASKLDPAAANHGAATSGASEVGAAEVTHTAAIAVETDYEFYARLGGAQSALDYLGDLHAFASTIYERELNTNLVVTFVRLWPDGSSTDPWSGTSTGTALSELRTHWIDNMGHVDRALVHFLSGKSLGGGRAYLSALCNDSYGYGVSGSLSGSFDINAPGTVWDILVTTHEMGHIFGSPHTQSYCGLGGVSDPVDLCYSSSCGSSLGLPGEGALSGGSSKYAPGTIMSYCHLLSGGYGNISLTLGRDHAYGVAPGRVPDRMYEHVRTRDPQCLALDFDDPLLVVSLQGTGAGTVTGDGIDCGADCREYYTDGEVVALAATAAPGSRFLGWGGDCSTDGRVTMSGDRICTANFEKTCGNGQLDEGEQCDGTLFVSGATCGGCNGTPACTDQCQADFGPCFDGVCSEGENCETCSADCAGGVFGGASCGNGVCEAADGEDCLTCAADCAGEQSGDASQLFCCGAGGGVNPVTCADVRCGGASACVSDPAPGGKFCCGDGACTPGSPEDGYSCELDCGPPPDPYCGDGICNGAETQCNCAGDCGLPPSTEVGACSDGVDNDCDGFVDGDDVPDCARACLLRRSECSTNSDCCSTKCRGRPGKKKCRGKP